MGSLRPLDFDAFVRFLKAHGHNFTLLWSTELPRFHGLPTTETAPPDFTVESVSLVEDGPGTGDRRRPEIRPDEIQPGVLRSIARAGAGPQQRRHLCRRLSVHRRMARCVSAVPTDGYPFSGPNNINGVDDGYRGGSAASAVSSVTMTAPNAITERPGRLRQEDHRHAERPAERALDRLRRSSDRIDLVEQPPDFARPSVREGKALSTSRSATDRSESSPRIRSSTTPTRTGSPRGPGFLPPSRAAPASPPARSTSTTATTATSGCGTTRHRRTGITSGRISRTATRSCSWTRTWFTTRARSGTCALLPSTASAARPTRAGTTSGTISDISCGTRASSIWPTSLRGALSARRTSASPRPPHRGGIPGLRSERRFIHVGSLGHAGLADAGGRMVQPGDGNDDTPRSDSGRVVLPVVHSAIQRRCGALPGGYRGPPVTSLASDRFQRRDNPSGSSGAAALTASPLNGILSVRPAGLKSRLRARS